MQKKFSIRLDEQVIERAKKYAREDELNLSPGVKQMVGILRDSGLHEEDYKKYLIDKYL